MVIVLIYAETFAKKKLNKEEITENSCICDMIVFALVLVSFFGSERCHKITGLEDTTQRF